MQQSFAHLLRVLCQNPWMPDDELLRRVEHAFERNERAFERVEHAFERNTGAFERNSAVLDATLERLHRSEEEHKEFMREMMLRFEKLDERMTRKWDDLVREWDKMSREAGEDRRVHDRAILSILDRLERLGPGGSEGQTP